MLSTIYNIYKNLISTNCALKFEFETKNLRLIQKKKMNNTYTYKIYKLKKLQEQNIISNHYFTIIFY